MREFKFRVWDYNKKKFIFTTTNPLFLGMEIDENDFENVEFQQYVGLKDIDGTEIYEGDIVDAQGHDRVSERGEYEDKSGYLYKNAIIKWCNKKCSFFVSLSFYRDSELLTNFKHFKVIGNIYEDQK
jgi:uncharacterized phage protein (TIGR01671 family)